MALENLVMPKKKINIVWDATMLDTFASCFFKFNVRFNLNKVPLTKAEPLDKGDLIHYGFEAYYKALQQSLPWDSAVSIMTQSIRERAATESDLPQDDITRTIEVMEESTKVHKNWDLSIQILEVEKSFAYVLYEDDDFRIVMIGKIDLLFSDNTYTRCPVDHKSYSRDSQFATIRKRNQFINYATAVDSNFLFVNRVGYQTSIEPSKKHKLVPLSYDPIYKEQWRQNVIKWAMRYYDCVVNNDWPLNDTSCDKFNHLCEYYDICDTTGDENKAYKLNVNFKTDEPWDVSKILAQGNKHG